MANLTKSAAMREKISHLFLDNETQTLFLRTCVQSFLSHTDIENLVEDIRGAKNLVYEMAEKYEPHSISNSLSALNSFEHIAETFLFLLSEKD